MIKTRMRDSLHVVTDQIVVFTLDDLSYALPLNNVVKVIHVVEVRSLPDAPEIITGIINVRGRIIPVADIRKRLGHGANETDINDRLIIADTGKRVVAILADNVTGIRSLAPGQLIDSGDTLSFAGQISGVAKVEEGLVLIYDLDQLLSIGEEKQLEEALKK
jgi:purine-binding chemotaxis protein CheW